MKVASLLILLCKCSSRLSDTSVLNTLETITRERDTCKRRVTGKDERARVCVGEVILFVQSGKDVVLEVVPRFPQFEGAERGPHGVELHGLLDPVQEG
jgi:hypothetical protein